MEKTVNFLVPQHRKLAEKEITPILEKYSIEDTSKLPKIKVKDPALEGMDVVEGDIIEITRTSFAGQSKYYRVATN